MIFASDRPDKYSDRAQKAPGEHSPRSLGIWIIAIRKRDVQCARRNCNRADRFSDPNSHDINQLDPDRSPPDEFIVRGWEIYLRLPHGVGRTKLTNNYFDSKLRTTSTGRNWRTVMKLSELT
jgi:uncharacterized protein (DUF1697 family)